MLRLQLPSCNNQNLPPLPHSTVDEQWMHQTSDHFWNYAQWVVKWMNSLLIPPTPQILQLMGAATNIPALARKIANGFNHPPDYAPWWFDPAEAAKVIKQMAGPAA
jgi:hypothetical protein